LTFGNRSSNATGTKADYYRKRRLNVLFIIAFTVLAVASFFITIGFGTYHISLFDSLQVFIDHLTGNIRDETADLYIWEYRVPRALGAILVGCSLSIAGVIMQNDFRNPLAEPYTMGISSGAFMGAILSIVFGISLIPFLSGIWGMVGNSFLFSLLPVAIIVVIGRFKKMTPGLMILTGIAILFMFSSITQIIMVTAPAETMADAYAWRVGSLDRIRWDHLPVIAPLVIALCILLWFFYKRLNVMYAGDKPSQTMGVEAQRTRMVTLVLASLLTAATVSFTGTIGFIGLVGPHVARIFVGSDNRYLIPAAAAFGSAFIILADTVAKVSGPDGLPVGVISSMVGGPLFIWILVRQRKSAWM